MLRHTMKATGWTLTRTITITALAVMALLFAALVNGCDYGTDTTEDGAVATAALETGDWRVEVYDQHGDPVGGATVQAGDYFGWTGQDGAVEFYGLPMGEATVQVTVENMVTVAVPEWVGAAGGTTTVELLPTPATNPKALAEDAAAHTPELYKGVTPNADTLTIDDTQEVPRLTETDLPDGPCPPPDAGEEGPTPPAPQPTPEGPTPY